MVLRIFRVLWFVSVLVLFVSLLYNYAGWQDTLVIQENNGGQVTIGKDPLFYLLVGIISFINVLVYFTAKVYRDQEDFRSWFHGLLITINIFFVLAISLIGVYNSTEVFDFSRVGFLIYGSVGLVGLWAVSWPVYLLCQKFLVKQPV